MTKLLTPEQQIELLQIYRSQVIKIKRLEQTIQEYVWSDKIMRWLLEISPEFDVNKLLTDKGKVLPKDLADYYKSIK